MHESRKVSEKKKKLTDVTSQVVGDNNNIIEITYAMQFQFVEVCEPSATVARYLILLLLLLLL